MTKLTPQTIDWDNLGFNYIDTGAHYRAYYKDGQWSAGEITADSQVHISQGSTAIHYGQQCFEGMKAYRTKDGTIQLFRPDQNAKRMVRSAEAILMVPYPEELFVQAVHQVVQANADWVPPYGTGGTLYIRPFLIGVGDNVGVKPATEYIFGIFTTPVGPYFQGGLTPTEFMISQYDRAAPAGTGHAKVGGNYAASYKAGQEAKNKGYSDAVFLDPATHTKIEEVGSANFYAITEDNKFVTPKSPSILPSITKSSLLYIAEHRLGLEVEETDIYLEDLHTFKEAGAMGTAAVISPIGAIVDGDTRYEWNPNEAGEITHKLYDELVGIQFGDIEAPEGWIQIVEEQ